MDCLPPLFNFIEVELHRDESGRTLYRNARKTPSELQLVKHLFITESPGLHPVQQKELEQLTEPELDRLTSPGMDGEHLATDYEFTDEESDGLTRFPQNLLLGSGLVIPQQTLYLRGSITLEKSKTLCVQRRSVIYYDPNSYTLETLFKKKKE